MSLTTSVFPVSLGKNLVYNPYNLLPPPILQPGCKHAGDTNENRFSSVAAGLFYMHLLLLDYEVNNNQKTAVTAAPQPPVYLLIWLLAKEKIRSIKTALQEM